MHKGGETPAEWRNYDVSAKYETRPLLCAHRRWNEIATWWIHCYQSQNDWLRFNASLLLAIREDETALSLHASSFFSVLIFCAIVRQIVRFFCVCVCKLSLTRRFALWAWMASFAFVFCFVFLNIRIVAFHFCITWPKYLSVCEGCCTCLCKTYSPGESWPLRSLTLLFFFSSLNSLSPSVFPLRRKHMTLAPTHTHTHTV